MNSGWGASAMPTVEAEFTIEEDNAMKTVRIVALCAVLTGAVVGGLYWMAPVTHGQVFVTSQEPGRRVVREVQVLGGRGNSIGVTVRDITDEDITKLKLPDRRGAVIDDVDEDSPASKAGFKAGDVVVSFDGEPVRTARQFSRLVDEASTGWAVQATVVRQGLRVDLDVTPRAGGGGMRFGWQGSPQGPWRGERFDLPAMPDLRGLERLNELPDQLQIWTGRSTLGVGVQSLTGELATYFGAKNGVLVSSVQADSAAAKAGIKVGDVITSLNGKSVEDPSALRRSLREADQADVSIGIVRDHKPLSLKATIERGDRQSARRKWPV